MGRIKANGDGEEKGVRFDEHLTLPIIDECTRINVKYVFYVMYELWMILIV